MKDRVEIVSVDSIEPYIEELSGLLMSVVEDGASIGFLPPLSRSSAKEYWAGALQPGVALWIAQAGSAIVGSVQLQSCMKPNGLHRAEIAKLMVHADSRRRGIGRLLMERAEERAGQEGRSLLVLDTREGDPSNVLYASLGYVHAGTIPRYARSANGELEATRYYYKLLGADSSS
ncbi:GNAT family N-acetyltransferase [Paenibacillus sp. PAMC21692]|uniref:GNAT family N-acetyltransferase n=1 Tax=Paenibacillus sp. PAMC21692 TaxID=2762320 RepID=UPI00164E1D76|nr:GNAT family N-acetyltransferase [Paenibacillus sp. PAMC21692]QNK56887.1 GNAT family N-acetyltransferase [Paenibacillus sp. PAMC21692]